MIESLDDADESDNISSSSLSFSIITDVVSSLTPDGIILHV